ncbi:GDP-mannose mannosyl hydrolase [Buttiauxella noackiae]|uniref:GDP-mannose mannosyl hydrolase n=1 Tax=Buttiauxella noackiae TaxID=82992 RepID=UPI0028D7F200|nr:GDP-mannose mannosyl hydrolase [Buttiauxella noackiae]
MLDYALFKMVVNNAPLISIDLIIYNNKSEVLLGKRMNSPARNYYFVPGGRIYKNETIDAAFRRICLAELGLHADFSSAKSLGVYEHFYQDAFVGADISTHYVVLAYELHLDLEITALPPVQHDQYIFMSVVQAKKDTTVHFYSQQYFN